MFTRFLNSIRESIARGGGPNNRSMNNNNNGAAAAEHHAGSEYSTDLRRRSSVTEELEHNDTHSMFSTSQSLPVNRLGRNNSIAVSTLSEPIPIETTASGKRRRSSTVFGISNVTADDYVQKDLISSSWS